MASLLGNATYMFREMRRRTPAVFSVLILCIAVFLVESVLGVMDFSVLFPLPVKLMPDFFVPAGAVFDRMFGLYPPALFGGAIWQLATYAFLHASIWHLLLNMFTLVFLGSAVEQIAGSARFWRIFALSAVVGAMGWLLCEIAPHLLSGESTGWECCVGASGGVFGLIGAYCRLCPRRKLVLLLFYVIPVKIEARYVAALLALATLAGMFSGLGRIAYAAHLAGGVFGYFYAGRPHMAAFRGYYGL